MQPYLSIIIPTLNEADTLPTLLDDLCHQTFHNFEVHIVDAASTDDTPLIAKTYQKLLPHLYIHASPKPNVAFQRNLGVQQAQGKYVLFNDADNQLAPDFLAQLHAQLEKHQPDLFTCWALPDSSRPQDEVIANILNLNVELSLQLKAPKALGALIGVRTEYFHQTTGFNPNLGFAEDGEFFTRLYKQGAKTQIFRQPRFTYSFRRFRRQGTLKALRVYAHLHTKNILNLKVDQSQEYPMGGTQLVGDANTRDLITQINSTFTNSFKIPRLRQRAIKFLSDTLPNLND